MFTEEAIKRAAIDHANQFVYYDFNVPCATKAFIAGALWVLRQVQIETSPF